MKSKEQRKQEAMKRQQAYDTLTKDEKIAKLDKGNFKATKQRIKLEQEN